MFQNSLTRAVCALSGVLALYAVQILTHNGDFWPFSAFAMYSKGRTAWSRPVIRNVPPSEWREAWLPTELEELPGEPFSLFERGVSREELRDLFDENHTWSEDEILSLRFLVGQENVQHRCLLVFDARGKVDEHGVDVECVPLALLTRRATRVNPVFGPSRLTGDVHGHP